jgi:ATP-dependent RNA helicase RhlE
MPDTVEAYTHRIGRTGRAAMTGDAYTFVTGEDRAFVWSIESALGETIEKRSVEYFDYSVPSESREERRPERSGRGRRQGGTRARRDGAAESSLPTSSPCGHGSRPQGGPFHVPLPSRLGQVEIPP